MDLLNKDNGAVLAAVNIPDGWECDDVQEMRYSNFCYPVKMNTVFKSSGAQIFYITGEGFSYIGGADQKTPSTLFIDYRPFEFADEYIDNYAEKLGKLTGKNISFIEKRDVPYNEEKGKEKVKNHAEREIKRQGGNNNISIIKLYYEAAAHIYSIEGKKMAICTHMEAVKAGMEAKGLTGRLAGKVTFGSDDDLKNLNPFQTMDWESNGLFILVADNDRFEETFTDLISIYDSFEEKEGFEESSEKAKKDIQGKLFMHGKSSKKMQIKKYNEWRAISEKEKKAEDELVEKFIIANI